MNENPRSSPNTTTMAAVRRVLSRQWCGRRARTRVPEFRVAVTGREKFPLCAAIPPPPSARPEQGIDIDPVHADAPVQVRTRRQAGATHPAHDGPFEYLLAWGHRSEEHTSELQSHSDLVCRLLLEKKKTTS